MTKLYARANGEAIGNVGMEHQWHLKIVEVGVVARELGKPYYAILLSTCHMEVLELRALQRVLGSRRYTES